MSVLRSRFELRMYGPLVSATRMNTSSERGSEKAMILDCNGCVMRDKACHDCVVTALLGPIDGSISEHADVLHVLSDAGLVSPLRLVVAPESGSKAADGKSTPESATG